MKSQYLIVILSLFFLLLGKYASVEISNIDIESISVLTLLIFSVAYLYGQFGFLSALSFILVFGIADFYFDVVFEGVLHIPKESSEKPVPWLIITLAKIALYGSATLGLTIYHRFLKKKKIPSLNWSIKDIIPFALALVVHFVFIPKAFLSDQRTTESGSFIIYGFMLLVIALVANVITVYKSGKMKLKYHLSILLTVPVFLFHISLLIYYQIR